MPQATQHRIPSPPSLMAEITTDEAAGGLQLLADAALDGQQDLENISPIPIQSDSDEKRDSECAIFDSYYAVGGSQSISTITNLGARKFQKVWDNIHHYTVSDWNVGRGRKCQQKPKDVLFMTLCVRKHGGKWDFLARIFEMKGPPSSHANRPIGTLGEAKKYYSGKHKLYRYKVEISVAPSGMAIFCSDCYPGSVSDIDILGAMSEAHEMALGTSIADSAEVGMNDMGPLRSKYTDFWAVLADKGYQGAIEFLRLLHPKKKPQHGFLTVDEERTNKDISSDRIIVENYFGRLCGLWDMLSRKYRWREKNYETIFKLCLALTNLHIIWHPLRAEDSERYQKHKNRQYIIWEEILTKQRKKQKRYRLKRKVCAKRRLTSFRRAVPCTQSAGS